MPVVWSVVVGTLFPSATASLATLCAKDGLKYWYPTIKRPQWTPPAWAFSPVWNSIYCTIGYGSYLVYRDGGGFNGPAKWPLIVYSANLVCNWTWITLFFNYHNVKLAYYETHLISLTALGSAYLFYKINPTAGYLFIPYILWLGFASVLGHSIYKLNSNKSGSKITELKEK